MGEKAALLFLHGDAATEHLRFVRTAGAVLPLLRPEERAPSGVRPTDRQQVFFVVQLLAPESALAVGFGNSAILIFFAPIILLFNYTKIPKNKTVSMLVPVIGIGLIILIVIQGIYQLISIAPIPKMDGQALKEMLNSAFSAMSEV